MTTMSATDTSSPLDNLVVPTWLQDPNVPDPRYPSSPEARKLRTHNLECLFERILERVSEGGTVIDAVENDHNNFTLGEVMRWIRGTPERRDRYAEAKKVRAEIYMEQTIGIADGDGMEDTQRSKLRIDTRVKSASFDDRERYGDKTTIDVTNNTTITLQNLIDERNAKMKQIIEGTATRVD